MLPRRIFCLVLAMISLFVGGCATTNPVGLKPSSGISGYVTYREPITLPRGTRLHLTLLDSAKDASATPLASSEFKVSGGAPIAFHLPVSQEVLSSAGRPLLFAQILVAGRPWFSNAVTPIPVDIQMTQTPLTVPLQNDMRPL